MGLRRAAHEGVAVRVPREGCRGARGPCPCSLGRPVHPAHAGTGWVQAVRKQTMAAGTCRGQAGSDGARRGRPDCAFWLGKAQRFGFPGSQSQPGPGRALGRARVGGGDAHLALGLGLRPHWTAHSLFVLESSDSGATSSWLCGRRFFLRLLFPFEARPWARGRAPDPEESVTVSSEKDLSRDVSRADSGAVSSSPLSSGGPVVSSSPWPGPPGETGRSVSWLELLAPEGLALENLRGFRA